MTEKHSYARYLNYPADKEKLDFVGITERFEESMVLLAQELCWPMHTIAGMKKKVFLKARMSKHSKKIRK